MADSITSSATFSTAFMKPAASGGETIDAVWGRNSSDNAGYNYYRKVHYPSMNISYNMGQGSVSVATTRATYYFNHRTEHGTVHGSYFMWGSSGGAGGDGSMAATAYCDGTYMFSWRPTGIPAGGEGSTTGSFIFPKGHLTHNTDYTFSVLMRGVNGSHCAAVLNVSLFGVP